MLRVAIAPADETDEIRQHRDWPLALGGEQAFSGEQMFELLQAQHELADTDGLQRVHAKFELAIVGSPGGFE